MSKLTAKPLEFRPLFDDQKLLVGGYTPNECWVCTIDARYPKGLFGISARFSVGPEDDYFAEHLPSLEEAKIWAQQAWKEILGEWIITGSAVKHQALTRPPNPRTSRDAK